MSQPSWLHSLFCSGCTFCQLHDLGISHVGKLHFVQKQLGWMSGQNSDPIWIVPVLSIIAPDALRAPFEVCQPLRKFLHHVAGMVTIQGKSHTWCQSCLPR